MAIEVFNRYEHKYLITREQYMHLNKVLIKYMDTDKYNKNGDLYTICNIYYDTECNDLIRTSLSKPDYKEKLRLRSYGIPSDSNSKVFLEIKKKCGGLVNKRRTALTLAQAYSFSETGIPPDIDGTMNGQVIKELKYFIELYRPVPKLFLAYDRMAFFDRESGNLRISFDTNIRTRRENVLFGYGDCGEHLLDNGMYLMEIKTSLAKPLWLTKLLCELEIKRQSFSKYGTEYKHFLRQTLNTNTGEIKYEQFI